MFDMPERLNGESPKERIIPNLDIDASISLGITPNGEIGLVRTVNGVQEFTPANVSPRARELIEKLHAQETGD